MDAPVGIWEMQTGRHESGENYRIGKIVVGSAGYNGTRSKGDPLTHRAYLLLPGITMKDGTDRFPNMEEAKARLEAAVATWFRWLS